MNTIAFDDVEFPVPHKGLAKQQKAIALLEKCAKTEDKFLTSIRKAGSKATRLKRVHRYLSSPACRITASVQQAKKLEPHERLPLSAYVSIAKSLSLFHPILETTDYWDVLRSNGVDYRRLHEFGPRNRTAQWMVMRVISAFFKPCPFQYNVGGRGRDKAIKFIKKKFGEGYVHALKLDVKNFFGSFSREGLYKLLPLPKSVIDNVVMPDTLQLKSKKGMKSCKLKLPMSGDVSLYTSSYPSPPVLPQGSLHAPIIAEYAVSLMGIVMPEGVMLVIYVDDVFIMAKSTDDPHAATHALFFSYGESPAGNFEFKVSDDTLLGGIDFLGYRLEQSVDGELTIKSSPANLKIFQSEHKRLTTKITKASKTSSYSALVAAIAEYYIYMRSWVASFQAADGYGDMVINAQERMVYICRNHGVSPAEIKHHAKAHYSHTTSKVKTKGGYKWEVKIIETDPAFEAILQAHEMLSW